MKNVLLELNGKELKYIEMALNHLALISLFADCDDVERLTQLTEISALEGKILNIIEDNFEIIVDGLNNS